LSTDDTSLVRARGLTKRFPTLTAVDHVDFDVRAGEAFGFLGPNGAGKTSIMRMIGCASPISEGELRVMDMDPRTEASRIKARLGVIPQLDNLDTELTVRENLLMYARYFDVPRAVAERRAAELLEFVQLTERATANVEPLSGGMKRRLTIARGLINEPDLLLLDEPTTGLGSSVSTEAAGRHAPPHHALHGRGGAALRSSGRRGQGADRGRRIAAAIDRALFDA
jgi:lipooligosaccharide transport system ATP-binding protein